MDCEQEIEATEKQIAMARPLRHSFRRDGQRPAYHFLTPAAWMNDINGTLFWQGRYHIFYQYNPDAAYWERI